MSALKSTLSPTDFPLGRLESVQVLVHEVSNFEGRVVSPDANLKLLCGAIGFHAVLCFHADVLCFGLRVFVFMDVWQYLLAVKQYISRLRVSHGKPTLELVWKTCI